MKPKDDEPLWLAAIPDREPWRRGREAIILISVLILLGEGVLIVAALMRSDIETLVVRLITGWFASLLLYFVWIGQNWARWLMAPLFGAYGCWDFVWGLLDGNGLKFVTGIASLIVFSYLAVSPAVYAFARHQRARVTLLETLGITGVFILIFLTLGSGIFGFYNYQRAVKADATEFAQMTFHRVFVNRDPEYLAAHSSATKKGSSPQAFINRIDSELGDVQSVGPFGAKWKTKIVPYHLELRGAVKTRAIFNATPAWVLIEISGMEAAWKIEHISWDY